LAGPLIRALTASAVGVRVAGDERAERVRPDRALTRAAPAPSRAGADAERDAARDEGERASNSARLLRDDGGHTRRGAHFPSQYKGQSARFSAGALFRILGAEL
jgi:hypothetical protein